MKYLLAGINHKSADVALLERCFFDASRREAFRAFLSREAEEVVILQTCNRLECYLADPVMDADKLQEIVEDFLNLDSGEFARHFYVRQGFDCVSHLLLVATSLDSVIVGESQILGQIKKSYMEAGKAGWTGKYLNRLFETAVRVGKRARTETSIARGAVSIAQAAIELAKAHFSSLAGLNVLIIGAGQTGRLALQHLLPENPGQVFLTNRTYANAEKMAEMFGVEALPFESFRSCLNKVNIIIAAVSAKDYVLSPADFSTLKPSIMPKAVDSGQLKTSVTPKAVGLEQLKMFIADISLPRVVDPAVAELESLLLFDIFDLQDVRDRNLEQRLSEKEKVEAIVTEELNSCRQWYDTQRMVPLIARIDEWKTAILSEELEKRKQKLADFSPEQLQLTKRMISTCLNKSIHLSYCLLKNGFSEERAYMSEKMAEIVSDAISIEKKDQD